MAPGRVGGSAWALQQAAVDAIKASVTMQSYCLQKKHPARLKIDASACQMPSVEVTCELLNFLTASWKKVNARRFL